VVYDADVAALILVNVRLSVDDCHWMVPVFPVKLSVVVLPEHIVRLEAVAVPATDTGFTVTVSVFELAEAQTPLVTTDR
jgi:hypothetical protein